MIKHLGVPYSDVLSMPTYERRFFLTTLINENQKKQEMLEEQQNNVTSSRNGKRTTNLSGQALKTQIKSGKLPSI
jgi:hypothetical protein